MTENTTLEMINPALASCFTIFALIYSVVGEFFGAKQPTADELQAKKTYLASTAGILEDIRKLEEKGKGPGWIERSKRAALEVKAAARALTSTEDDAEETTGNAGPDTDELSTANLEETDSQHEAYEQLTDEEKRVAKRYPNSRSWLTESDSTVALKDVSTTLNVSMKLLHNRVAGKQIRATRNREIVFKSSVVAWVIAELLPAENKQAMRSKATKVEPESAPVTPQKTTTHLDMVEGAMLKFLHEASPGTQAELRELAGSKPLGELAHILQERYPNYAMHFTEEHVAHVMAAFQAERELSPV
jgi:hypothetical protein